MSSLLVSASETGEPESRRIAHDGTTFDFGFSKQHAYNLFFDFLKKKILTKTKFFFILLPYIFLFIDRYDENSFGSVLRPFKSIHRLD